MAKRKRSRQADQSSHGAVDNTRGSALWAFNYFRWQILTNLLDDLVEHERDGLPEEYCNQLTMTLERFVNATTEIPSGGLLVGTLSPLADRFTVLYREWNDIHGESAASVGERRYKLQQMREQRQKITNKASQLQYAIQHELNHALMRSSYRALSDLITLAPDLFKNVADALKEFAKRGGSIK